MGFVLYYSTEVKPSTNISNFYNEIVDIPMVPRLRLVPMEYGDGRGNAGAEIKQNLIGRDVYQDHKQAPKK